MSITTASGFSVKGKLATAVDFSQTAGKNSALSHTNSADRFINIGNLSYTASSIVGAVDGEVLTLKVTATDNASASVNAPFNLMVASVNSAPTFVAGGIAMTDFDSSNDYGQSVTVQADGKILVAGYSYSNVGAFNLDFALVRYNLNGSLDTGFNGDGKVITDFGFYDYSQSVTVQDDGKILVAGTSKDDAHAYFALARYNSDGSLDTGFDGDGKVVTNIDSDSVGGSVTVQADGKILVAGTSWNSVGTGNFALVRYNANGSLDSSFDGDGKVTTDFGNPSGGSSVTMQADGKILVAGTSWNNGGIHGTVGDLALVRYNPNGSLDTSFDGDGKVTTDLGDLDWGQSVTLQVDGKILVTGSSYDDGNNVNFSLVRYNPDGSLDTGFDGDGKVTTDFDPTFSDEGYFVTVQADGKILVAGQSNNSNTGYNFALARYNTDGSLDTSFSDDGKVTTSTNGGYGSSVSAQADGKILVAGFGSINNDWNFALVRYNPDGSLDKTFGGINTLDSSVDYIESGAVVALDYKVQIYDAELSVQGHYQGASITLLRHGGANSQDVFSGRGDLTISGGHALLSGVTIGAVNNGNGTLKIMFNSNATQERVDAVLSSLAYSNSSDKPPASVQIDWLFNDGNTGAQGTGGALTALGSTTVNIYPINDAPTLSAPAAIHYIDTAFDDSFSTATGTLSASDAENDSLSYDIKGGKDNGDGTISKIGAYGTLTVTQATGAYHFTPNDHAIERLSADKTISFTMTVSDGLLSDSTPLVINITQNGSTESAGNDILVGTTGHDVIRGLAGDDHLSGNGGNDGLYGGVGNDSLSGGNGSDVLRGSTGDDVLTGGTGHDVLIGGAGNDVLTGGSGRDTFRFNSPLMANIEHITDFNPINDTLQLQNSIFTRLSTTGVLSPDNLVIAAAAVDSNDYLIYHKATGTLFYDADGSDAGLAVKIATLGVSLTLTNADFVVI
ncbi:MAG: hypothetical protein Q7U57_02065 [Methylovulum sp.]|nr:hypothetical protein [Methylovulum sp.]